MSSYYIKLGAGQLSNGPSGGLTDSQLRASPVPVSVSSIALPAGAATSALQNDQITELQNIEAELQAANISLVAIDANTDTIETKLDNLETSKKARSLLVDEASPTVTYVCEAAASSLTSAAVWRIKRITTSGSVVTVQWAAAGAYTQIANNRAALTYV